MVRRLRCELISWQEVRRLCVRLADQIQQSGYRPAVVIAIGRGGYVPARLLCDYLDIMALTSIKIEHYLAGASRQPQAVIRYPLCTEIRDRDVLLVDDVNDSGETVELAVRHLVSFRPRTIRTVVMHHKTTSKVGVDFFAKKIVKWRWLIYPWAVVEDIAGFFDESPPANLEQARETLADRYGLALPSRQLQEVYRLWSQRTPRR